MRLVASTDIGKTRDENQDDYRASIQGENTAWAVVCDGMGGAAGGAAASGLAVGLAQQTLIGKSLGELDAEGLQQLGGALVREANTRVYQCSLHQPELRGMGTTMVVVLAANNVCSIASVGDSRAYLFRDGTLCQLTRDHSMVQELVEKGIITPEEASIHPQRNVITRAVGIQSTLEVDTLSFELKSSDVVLICTDGLTNAVDESTIEGILSSAPFYNQAALLIQQVLRREEQDNSTVVLLSAGDTDTVSGEKKP